MFVLMTPPTLNQAMRGKIRSLRNDLDQRNLHGRAIVQISWRTHIPAVPALKARREAFDFELVFEIAE